MRKIPFNLKYRPEIESGEMKVVNGRGKPVTILKWDMQGNYPILGIVMTNQINYEGDESWEEERPFAYNDEGRAAGSAPSEKKELYILIDGPDTSAFESELCTMLEYARKHSKPDTNVVDIFKDRIFEYARRNIMDSLPKWTKCEASPYDSGVYRVDVGSFEYMGYQIDMQQLFDKLEKEK